MSDKLHQASFPSGKTTDIKLTAASNSTSIKLHVRTVYIMLCVVGGSLTTVIETMELDEYCIATVTAECLKALSYLHSKRIIHRDIKVRHSLYLLKMKSVTKFISTSTPPCNKIGQSKANNFRCVSHKWDIEIYHTSLQSEICLSFGHSHIYGF